MLSVRAALPVLLLLVAAPLAAAQPAPEPEPGGAEATRELRLEDRGGVAFQVPAWETARADGGVAVLTRAPDRSRGASFGVLVLTVEEGPRALDAAAWERIRDNVVAGAAEKGTPVTLALGEAFGGAAGFEGRRLSGTLQASERTVRLEMVALVRDGTLVTVSALGPSESDEPARVAAAVAATAKGPSAP